MLKKISKIISPELMKIMMEMGHSDCLLIADANFPGTAHAKRIIRMDAVDIPELLIAILNFFPLDNFVEYPVYLMKNSQTEPVPEIWQEYRKIIKEMDSEQAFTEFAFLERQSFYQAAEKAYAIVQTGDTTRYANLMLQKGVC